MLTHLQTHSAHGTGSAALIPDQRVTQSHPSGPPTTRTSPAPQALAVGTTTAYGSQLPQWLPWWLMVQNPPGMRETWGQSLAWEDPLEKGTAICPSILAWRIPWTEEPGGLQSMGSQRVRHHGATFTFAFMGVKKAAFFLGETIAVSIEYRNAGSSCPPPHLNTTETSLGSRRPRPSSLQELLSSETPSGGLNLFSCLSGSSQGPKGQGGTTVSLAIG